jgi:hypothetical protein
MSFTEDIFISYSHIDDRPVDDVKGWVTTLHERLNNRLAQLVGSELKIWWDQREQTNQYLAGMIGERVSNTLLLVSIVTPRYLNSSWCRAEVSEFCRRADQAGGITIGEQPRIFKVVKTPVDPEHDMDELRGLVDFRFFEGEKGLEREFRQEVGANKDLKYWQQFEDLAQAIKCAIEAARPRQQAVAAEDLPLAKKVYLAQTTADLREERDRIKRELLQREFFVLPDHDLPIDSASEFEAAVREDLKRCVLSVNLIGESYGTIPDGEEERSVIRWQNDIAGERAQADPKFVRLIWMPPGLQPKAGKHAKLLEDLRTNLRTGSELLETPLEDLKTRILEKLAPPPEPAAPVATSPTSSGETDVTRVYLIHDNRDTDNVRPVDDFLYNEGFEVIRSINEGDQSQIAQYHRENLCTCDAALIYYGSGNELWLRSKFWDLQKAPGWGRARPMKAKGVYLSVPVTPSKQSFRTREVPYVMPNFGDFTPDTLQPFVKALKNGS